MKDITGPQVLGCPCGSGVGYNGTSRDSLEWKALPWYIRLFPSLFYTEIKIPVERKCDACGRLNKGVLQSYKKKFGKRVVDMKGIL
jgi:hypothetical protein